MNYYENEVVGLKIYNAFIKKTAAFISAAVIVLAGASFAPAEQVCCETTFDYQEYIDEVVILVNEARVEAGLNPVYAVPILHECSAIRAEETTVVFSHYRPDSTKFSSILNEYGIPWNSTGENNAAGSNTPEGAFEQWRNSPDHWATILNENYTHIGVGVCYAEDSVYGWYWEQLFIATDTTFEDQYLPERYVTTPASYGDIDGDGYVTSFDLILMMKLLKHEIVLNELQLESADCMKDAAHTIADAVVLKKYLLGEYDSLPISP